QVGGTDRARVVSASSGGAPPFRSAHRVRHFGKGSALIRHRTLRSFSLANRRSPARSPFPFCRRSWVWSTYRRRCVAPPPTYRERFPTPPTFRERSPTGRRPRGRLSTCRRVPDRQ